MPRPHKLFPLIGDTEPVTTSPRVMHLYENEDLITNISGQYHDKSYDEDLPLAEAPLASAVSSLPVFEPAEKARQEARLDVKKKRQSLMIREKPMVSLKQKSLSATGLALEKVGWRQYAYKLHQDSYILADLPTNNQEPQLLSSNKTTRKNNYDFLKRSQIYNQELHSGHREHHVAQELNLSHLEDIN